MGNQDLAKRILESRHAGDAERLSKEITDDLTRLKWEKENVGIVEHLLAAKAGQCKRFLECLMESKESVLAEATPSKFWGTGLSIFVIKNCSESCWLGQNMLDALLMELRAKLILRKDEESNVWMEESIGGLTSHEPVSSNSEDFVLVSENEQNESTAVNSDVSVIANDPMSDVHSLVEANTTQVTQTSLVTDVSDVSDDIAHVPRRPRERVPHLLQANRGRTMSVSGRKSCGHCTECHSPHTKKKDTKENTKGKDELMMTPKQTDIKKVLGVKRLVEDSPEDKADPKSQRQDNG